MRFLKSSKIIILFSLLAFSSLSNAGFLVEPYLGYQLGSGDRGVLDYDYNSPTMGARLGYTFLGFMGGVDYSLSSFDLETTNTSTNASAKSEYKKNQLGLFAGYELPILLRAWATYYLSAKLEDEIAPITETSGGGYALGVGFTGLPFVSLNAEYRVFSYDESETSGTTTNLNPDLEFKEIVLSVSIPLDL